MASFATTIPSRLAPCGPFPSRGSECPRTLQSWARAMSTTRTFWLCHLPRSIRERPKSANAPPTFYSSVLLRSALFDPAKCSSCLGWWCGSRPGVCVQAVKTLLRRHHQRGCERMPPRGKILIAVLSLLIAPALLAAQDRPLASTPPMGWNSWNKFGCNVSEDLVRQMADAMVKSGMKDVGYQYIVIDDCWQVDRDSSGNIVPDAKSFPSGIKALAVYLHSRGLKFGVYFDA